MRLGNTAEFTVNYEQDGREYTWTGTADVSVNNEAEYGEIGDFGISRAVKTYERTTITLDNVVDLKGRAVMKKDDSMNRITTTRKILVDDFTFGSIANARKKAGAPKDSTFEVGDAYNTEGTRREKAVTFIWTEVL